MTAARKIARRTSKPKKILPIEAYSVSEFAEVLFRIGNNVNYGNVETLL